MYNQQIATFLKVADCGSFSKAADSLFISTVSVMKQMNTLEHHVGFLLLKRTNRGVLLTEAGKSFYCDAKKIIQLSDDAIQNASLIATEEENAKEYTIRVATSILRPCKPLVDLWAKVDDGTLPFKISIIPFDDSPAGMNDMLASLGNTIDCFVSPCDSISWQQKYQILQLRQNNCCIAVPRNHILSKKKMLTWEDLDHETLLLLQHGESLLMNQIREDIEKNHPLIHILDTPNFYDTTVFNECEKRGCLMESLDIWDQIHPSLITLPMDWNYKMTYGIIYSKNATTALTSFINLVKKELLNTTIS
ncbi:transcription regulator [Lachnospiraceae bacterium KM106-2]|nr:transcription regulator [Lachnospiraceae bacterium KM106-2]